MDDAAAFKATFAGFRSLTSGGYRVSFDFDGPEIKRALEVLTHETHGEKPSVAKGTWFAIARLNVGGAVSSSNANMIIDTTNNHTLEDQAARNSLAVRAAVACRAPIFRVWLEQTGATAMNSYQAAHDDVCFRLGINSFKELDRDEGVAAVWEQLWAQYVTWKSAVKYVEPAGIQQENQA